MHCTSHYPNPSGAKSRIRITARILSSCVAFASLCVSVSCSNASKISAPTFSNASLKGNYNYVLSGTSFSSGGSMPYQEAGNFVADGNGNITGGTDDFVQSSTLTSSKITGTYTVSSNGNATMSFQVSRGSVEIALSLISSSSFYLIEYDSFGSGSGEALQQTPSAFSSTPSGTFVFRLHSSLATGAAMGSVSKVGQMVVQQGGISGNEDIVSDGVPGSSSLLGIMNAPDANGRGTADLNDDAGNRTNYIYYIIDSQTLKFLETDPGPLGGGRADLQTENSFSNASLTGGYSFRGRGDTLSSSFGSNSIGVFVSDGNGHITSGTYDAVQDGNPISNAPLTGIYSVESSGRATITLSVQGASPIPLIVWMISSSSGLLLVNSPNLSVAGRMDQQQNGPFSAESLSGQYAFYMFGSETPGAPSVNRAGVMRFDGNSNVIFSDYFVNLGGATSRKGPVSGTYAVSSNGRVVASSIGTVKTQIIYLISNSTGSLMLGSAGTELGGSIGQQPNGIPIE